MKKVLALSVLAGLLTVGNAFALSVNDRLNNITPGTPSDDSELTLQQILDSAVKPPTGTYDAINSQSRQALWSVNDVGSRSFLISLFTAHSDGSFGIYSQATGQEVVLIDAGTGGSSKAFTVSNGYLLDGDNKPLSNSYFGDVFGFFWNDKTEGYKAYTEDSANGNNARALVYQLSDGTEITLPGPFGPSTFTTDGTDDWLMSFEDHPVGDFDYNDATFFVKDITAPVPEPGTMMLLGAGFLGLAIYGKRRKNA